MDFYNKGKEYQPFHEASPYPDPMAAYQPVMMDEKILVMLEEGIKDQREAVEYYRKIMKMIPDPVGRKVMDEVRIDKMKHYKMFREIYHRTSGKRPNLLPPESKACSDELHKELEKSIFVELDSVEFYRTIYFSMVHPEYRDMVYEIITDVQEHATKLTYLYAKYKG